MTEDRFHISTDKSKLDLKTIHKYLSTQAYWSKGRDFETVRKSIENSLCFGAYVENEQVGFARVVTDYSIFAWILDVFVLDKYKGQGLGKKLISTIMAHPELQNLKRWGLTTEDAHGLYEKFGFHIVEKPGTHMELVRIPNVSIEV
jgi:GNAT superfamily N-acetyltransferase